MTEIDTPILTPRATPKLHRPSSLSYIIEMFTREVGKKDPELDSLNNNSVSSEEKHKKEQLANEALQDVACSVGGSARDPNEAVMLCPLLTYISYIGLSEFGAPRLFFRIYNLVTVTMQILISIRMLTLLGQISDHNKASKLVGLSAKIFNASSALYVTKLIFTLSGTLAALLLFFMQRRLPQIRAALERESVPMDRSKQKFLHKASVFMVFVTVTSSFFCAFSYITGLLGIVHMPWTPALISPTFPAVLLDGYSAFISQSSMVMVAALFGKCCIVIMCKTQSLIHDMVFDEEDPEKQVCMTKYAAIKEIKAVQRRYQALQDANALLESHFSFTLFYAYGCAIPTFCFTLYVILHDYDGAAKEPLELLVFIAWMLNIVGLLLCFSIPAFKVQEEGRKIIKACFQMYHQKLGDQNDTYLLAAIQFFSFQVESAKLTLTAASFFTMDRSIMLTLFSAIVTYFIILVQLDSAGKMQTAITG